MNSSDVLSSKGYLWDNVRCNTHEEALMRAKRFRQTGRFATVLKITGSNPCWKVYTRGKPILEKKNKSLILEEDIFLNNHLITKGTSYDIHYSEEL